MTNTPFRDEAKRIAVGLRDDYVSMQFNSDRARSHGWWRNLVEYGAWSGPGSTRVGPPTPEAIPGIAKLFGTSEDHVSAMIAADWYDVHPDTDVSATALRFAGLLDQLDEQDLDLLEGFAKRLAA